MLLRAVHTLVLVLACSALPTRALPLHAQPPPARDLLHHWRTDQAEQRARVAALTFIEQAVVRTRGPAGTRTLEIEARVEATMNPADWRREVLAARVNGHPVSPQRLSDLIPGWSLPRHAAFTRLSRAVALPPALLDRLELVAPAAPDTLDGIVCWRLEGRPTGDTPVERLTLWFTREGTQLLHSQVVLHALDHRNGRPLHTRLTIEHHYRRIQGLDLPVSRRYEGTRQYLRRGRIFTEVAALEARYSDFRFALR